MQLYSTTTTSVRVDFKTAVMRGVADDGGLYLPTVLPPLPKSFFQELSQLSPAAIGLTVARHLLQDELPEAELERIVMETLNFPLPVVPLNETTGILELFHGPTLAFKDVGARFMARVMGYYVQQADQPLTVLVATSGDTGSAVAHGFYLIPGVRVVILFPQGRVSRGQEQQFATLGENITALAVAGSFDDCQRLVKQALSDTTLRQHYWMTSANSINIARLIPQCFYYFIGYSQLSTRLPVVCAVPSGNFGNLTAGVMAQQLGLPIQHWIAATNRNDVVPRYLASGEFSPRPSHTTLSNAMDVGQPSNFARLLALYQASHSRMRTAMTGTSTTDATTRQTIQRVWQDYHYLLDPHTAVAYDGLWQYRQRQTTPHYGLCLATAHPAKFIETVAPLVGEEQVTLPPALTACLELPNLSEAMPNDYVAFRQRIVESTLDMSG